MVFSAKFRILCDDGDSKDTVTPRMTNFYSFPRTLLVAELKAQCPRKALNTENDPFRHLMLE